MSDLAPLSLSLSLSVYIYISRARAHDIPYCAHRLWILYRILGAGFLATQNTAVCSVQGSSGQRLHAGGAQSNSVQGSYSVINGRMFVGGSINVGWQLHDNEHADEGGFCICPGSHKSSLPIPERVQWCEDMTTVRHVGTKAGDVVLFLGSGVTHGALPWKSKTPRRVAILSYFSKYTSLFGDSLRKQLAKL